MSIRFDQNDRRDAILKASFEVFARYGFKRASMEDVAREAGISRAALYLSYENKSAIFAALVVAFGQNVCAAAESAWPQTAPAAEGLAAAAYALHGPAWSLIKGSPHGAELVTANSQLVGDVVAAMDLRFASLIADRIAGIQGAHDPLALAKMATAALHGIKDFARSTEELAAHITSFSRLFIAGLVGTS